MAFAMPHKAKHCTRCGGPRGFKRNKRTGKLAGSWCKSCRNDHARELHAKKPYASDPEYHRKKALKYRRGKAGWTEESFEAAWKKQDGRCAICERGLFRSRVDIPHKGLHACADHDHATGESRGILCHICNLAVGMYEKGRFAGVIAYVEKFRKGT